MAKKIDINSESKKIERLTKALANESKGQARAILNDLKKSAYNKQYRLQQQLKKDTLSPIERNILESKLSQAQTEYKQVSKDVRQVKSYINDNRHIRINQAINRLNIYEGKKEAQKEFLREQQKANKSVEGVSLLNISVNAKQKALLEKYVYNSKGAGFTENQINYIQNTLKAVLQFDFMEELQNTFSNLSSFASDDLFEALVDVSEGIKDINGARSTSLSQQERQELRGVVDIFKSKGM